MWPTGIPKALRFFAMVAHTPDLTKVLCDVCTLSGDRKECSTQIWCTLFTYTHTHTLTRKLFTWVFLSLPAWKGSLCHSNKPQKRKYGYYDQTVLGPRLEKHWCGNTDKTDALYLRLMYSHCTTTYLTQLTTIIRPCCRCTSAFHFFWLFFFSHTLGLFSKFVSFWHREVSFYLEVF